MNPKDTSQFSAVYAEAAIAFIETGVPQAVLYLEDEERWDFAPGDEPLDDGSAVAFVLDDGWDGQLSLDNPTDPDDEHYNAFELRDEIEMQMEEEGIARALVAQLAERREEGGGEEDENDHGNHHSHQEDSDDL